MSKITQARLKEVLHYDTKTGIFTWKTYMSSLALAGNTAGYKNKIDYIVIKIDYNLYYAQRLAWLYVNGYFPENEVDHINRNQSDNRIDNLREVSHGCNMRNTANQKDNTSGVKGVVFDKRDKKWVAQISINHKNCSGGPYKEFEEAVCARLALEQSLNWEGCDSSSPAFQYVQKYILNVVKI